MKLRIDPSDPETQERFVRQSFRVAPNRNLIETRSIGRGEIFADRGEDTKLRDLHQVAGSHEVDAERTSRSAVGQSDRDFLPIALFYASDDGIMLSMFAIGGIKNLDERFDFSGKWAEPPSQPRIKSSP